MHSNMHVHVGKYAYACIGNQQVRSNPAGRLGMLAFTAMLRLAFAREVVHMLA